MSREYATLEAAKRAALVAADAAQEARYVVRERGEPGYSVASGFDLDTFWVGCSDSAIKAEIMPAALCDICGRKLVSSRMGKYLYCRVCG